MPMHSQHCRIFSLGCGLQWNDFAAIVNMAFQSQLISCWAFSVLTKPSFWHSVPRPYKLQPVECLQRNRSMESFTCPSCPDPSEPKWCQRAGMISMHRMLITGAPWSPIFSLAPTPVGRHHWGHNYWKLKLSCLFHRNLSINTFLYGDTSKINEL